MGSNYSVGPFPKDFKAFINLELVVVRSKIFRFEKTVDKNFRDTLFLNKKDAQWALQLSDRLTYKLFQKMDTEKKGYMPALDLWGALALR